MYVRNAAPPADQQSLGVATACTDDDPPEEMSPLSSPRPEEPHQQLRGLVVGLYRVRRLVHGAQAAEPSGDQVR